MTTTIITATYNKPEYLRDAADSVFGQTDTDWQWWIALDGPTKKTAQLADYWAGRDRRIRLFHYDTTEDTRRLSYRPAEIANELYPQVETQFMMWLSDDDLLSPRFLEAMTRRLREGGGHVAYCRGVFIEECGNSWKKVGVRPRRGLPEYSRDCLPDGQIDGGQVLHTRESYGLLGDWKIPAGEGFEHSDGLFLNELAKRFSFLPCDESLFTRRKTCISESVLRKGQ